MRKGRRIEGWNKKEYEEREDADENGANDSLMKAEAEGRLEFRQRPGFFYIVPSLWVYRVFLK